MIKNALILGLIGLMSAPSVVSAGTIASLSAKIEPSLTQIKVEANLDDIVLSSYDTPDKVWNDLTVTLEGYKTKKEGTDSSDNAQPRYIWVSGGDPVSQITSGTKGSIKFSFTIKNNPDSTENKTIKTLYEEKNKKLRIKISIAGTDKETVTSTQLGRPASAPEGFGLRAGHRSIIANWKGNQKVSYTKNGLENTPEDIVLFAFKSSDSNLNIKAIKIESDPNTATEEKFSNITCTYDSSSDDHCIQCPEAGNLPYVLTDSQDADSAFITKVLSNKNEDSSYQLNDLDDEEYTFVLQYSGGIKRSDKCLKIAPGRTLSLTEANGEDEGNFKDTRCFIATAAYGTPYHHYVQAFRWFRSTYILKSELGKKFVSFYYENSPKYAKMIAKSPALKKVAQAVLVIPALTVSGFWYTHQNPWAAWLVAAVFVMLTAYGLRRRYLKYAGHRSI